MALRTRVRRGQSVAAAGTRRSLTIGETTATIVANGDGTWHYCACDDCVDTIGEILFRIDWELLVERRMSSASRDALDAYGINTYSRTGSYTRMDPVPGGLIARGC